MRLKEIEMRLADITSELDKENADLEALSKEVDDLKAEKRGLLEKAEKEKELRSRIASGKVDARTLTSFEEKKEERMLDQFNTMEYRAAFMNFCKTGQLPVEMRVDAYTALADVGTVIPTSIMNEILKKMTTYGQIFSRVRRLNVKGGVSFPVLSLKPVATWITEAAVSDRQKLATSSISFNYYGLECRIATSLIADTVTLASFENSITDLIVEAMTKEIDVAIIKGSGVGEPLGITVDPAIPAGQIITLAAADFVKWDGWKKKVFAKIPLSYRAGGSFIMAAGTFEGYIDGMVDTTGQPMGRVNYGITDGPQERFAGREIILVEDDIVAPYESAAAGDIVAIFCKLGDYGINSNMQMQMFRWLDQDKNQWVDKAILIADGKLIDANGVLIIKKGA